MGNVDKTSGGVGDGATGTEPRGRPVVTTIQGAADRTVFTESGNSDAWIATDLVADVRR